MVDISGLNPVAQAAAQRAIDGGLALTSGRRAAEDQARAMASDVVLNHKWIEQTYVESPVRDACQAWVDANPESAAESSSCATGLLGVLQGFSDADLRHLSWHMSGDAFDCDPDGNPAHLALLQQIIAESVASGGESELLTEEGGLTRWHLQLSGGEPPTGRAKTSGPAQSTKAAPAKGPAASPTPSTSPSGSTSPSSGTSPSPSASSTPKTSSTPSTSPSSSWGPIPSWFSAASTSPAPSLAPTRSAPPSPSWRPAASFASTPSTSPTPGAAGASARFPAPSPVPAATSAPPTRAAAPPPSAPAYPGSLLARGSSGDAVRLWQQRLAARGQDLKADGDFGPLTETATRQLQSAKGLDVDGIVGERTWAAAWT